jgi:hypothetical protein
MTLVENDPWHRLHNSFTKQMTLPLGGTASLSSFTEYGSLSPVPEPISVCNGTGLSYVREHLSNHCGRQRGVGVIEFSLSLFAGELVHRHGGAFLPNWA